MVSLDEKAISSNLLFQSRNELGTVNRTVCNVTSKTENTKKLWIQRFEFKSLPQSVEHHLLKLSWLCDMFRVFKKDSDRSLGQTLLKIILKLQNFWNGTSLTVGIVLHFPSAWLGDTQLINSKVLCLKNYAEIDSNLWRGSKKSSLVVFYY